TRKRATIQRENIEIGHFNRVGSHRADVNPPFTQHQSEISVRLRTAAVSRVNDKHPHHAEAHLSHLVGVRVVHECSVLPELKLILIGLARLDILLAKSGHSIHTGWHKHTMPMNTRAFRELVGYVKAHTVPLHSFNGWTMHLIVEPPTVSSQSWCELMIDFLGNQ